MSLHADALAVLSGWVAPTPAQDELRQRYVDHLAAHDDGVWRGCFPDHLTAGTLVVDESGEHVLLNLHRKARRWFAFGGHCEPGDRTLADAALREAREESGLADLRFDPVPAHLDEHAVPFCDPRGEVRHLDVRFVAQAPAGADHATSDESLDVRWWPVDGLPELEPEMHELIAVARARFA
ncbi:ADP-ribose pyrophosphatase YjhB (NUDIX family) [Nocardioides ginsengisegetis]|uniref:ADP-ribose pyrophosphatase YjhB (NUDIX family) n=1 Tax=Nocardioides ginsengisegetis TaxID=661491 RepID=A0A7W3IXP7_9ACTN|nr:ADP-ribose pyrophosphatase YjhB (NUDIX family) [Nocardioides ginsengisegetis]